METTTSLNPKRLLGLSLAAIGIVFGDIGTSPLYAFRESLYDLPVIPINIYGVLSLIFWALILVISIQYLCIILRADNDGEGGILALLALLKRQNLKIFRFLFVIGIIGAGLLLGDGMLTPAISLLSAVEGLRVISPQLNHFILPLTSIIVVILFLTQHHGTARIGKFFGPIIIVWLITLAVLGINSILKHTEILHSINPYYAFTFFVNNGWHGYTLLGGVFLVMTGGEALYADLGHFGLKPIRLAWFGLVLPALLLNYFGQGANLLETPAAIKDPFYALVPGKLLFPLIVIATLATIIASQAVITATFSLAKQGILLNIFPRIPIIQTSEKTQGQIYVPQMNFILAIGTLLLIFTFQTSSALAHAYGIAVNLVMFGVTLLVMTLARVYWKWSMPRLIAVFSIFICIDISFLGANIQKVISGGWVPLLFALIAAFIMVSWHKGLKYMRGTYYASTGNIGEIIDKISPKDLNFIPHTTIVFVTDPYDQGGGSLLKYLKLNQMLPEHVLIVSTTTSNHPYVDTTERYQVTQLRKGIYRVILHYGFMQLTNIPEALSGTNYLKIFPFQLNINRLTYLIDVAQVSATRRQKTLWFYWQEKLFAFLMRNAGHDIEFYKLPYDRTIAVGSYCEI